MKPFIRTMLACFAALLLFGALLFVAAAALTAESPPEVPKGAVMVIDLSVPITERPGARGAMAYVEGALSGASMETVTLHEVLEAIREAKKDDRIPGIYIHGQIPRSGLSSGWAALAEIRDALLDFRKAGKKVVAFDMNYTEREYYLASAADTVFIHPAGLMEFNGFKAEALFYAGALKKFGVDVQVVRAGRYKSAVEPFLLEKMSHESRGQLEALLADLFDVFLEAVSASRRVPVGDLKKIAETGFLEGRDAVEARLADRAGYFDDVIATLRTITRPGKDEKGFRHVSLADYLRVLEDEGADEKKKNEIAVICAEGDIVDGESEAAAGGDTVARLLRRARLDEEVKAVVLRVNSPGGSAAASDVILREVQLAGMKKPVVVSMGAVAASGGYWISCCAHEIVAEPNTVTGSIGVFGMFPSFKELLKSVGVTADAAKTAPHADMMSLYRPMTAEELDMVRIYVDRTYDDFLDRVSLGRRLDRDRVAAIAEGRVWSGRKARAIGLVDTLGGFGVAVEHAAARAGLGKEYRVVYYQKRKPLLKKILDSLTGNGEEDREPVLRQGSLAQGGVPFGRALRDISRRLSRLEILNDPRGIYALFPFDADIR